MDFSDSHKEAVFRAEARSWLTANATVRKQVKLRLTELDQTDDGAALLAARQWQSRKAEAGFARLAWPIEYGGRAAPPMHQVIFDREEAGFEVPSGTFFTIGLGMCIPTMIAFASSEQKARFVAPALRGDEIWCQLFSEPSAGSDLANLATRATREGEGWIIDGQKIWTSMAQHADFGLLLTRTDPSVAKHAGLTMFFVDMRSPGIDVRPIRQMSGGAHFNEVFFSGVRIPDAQRLGEPGTGWRVALSTLGHERLAIGGSEAGNLGVADLLSLARRLERRGQARHDTVSIDELAQIYADTLGLRFTNYRVMTSLSRGQQSGPEGSIGKLVQARNAERMARLALDMQGEEGLLAGADAPAKGIFQHAYLFAPQGRIAGGTDEILRTIIGERILGLPPEPRSDKTEPFSKRHK